jgi:hypothetical protein
VLIERTTTVVRTEGMMTAPVDSEIVILNMKGNNYISLDAIGRRIWEIIEIPVTVDDLCSRLGQEFEGTPEQIIADVQPFLEELEREGLVRVAG